MPRDFLQSLFVCELVSPSPEIWISSPWISDVPLIDNTARQFTTLCPEWPAAPIRLAAILGALLDRGTRITIITNEAVHNDEFVDRTKLVRDRFPQQMILHRAPDFHEKGILTDHFWLSGSMNLTYGGVYINEEYLTFGTDRATIAERRLEYSSRWRQ